MYKVVKLFTDLQDNEYLYQPGDTFPRAGFEVSEERLAELSGYNNRRGIPLIVKMYEKAPEDEDFSPSEVEIPPMDNSKSEHKKSHRKANKEK